MTMRKPAPILLSLAFVAGLAGSARAEVDVQVPATFKAKGSLAGDADVFRFEAARETVLSLKVSSLRGAPLDFTVTLDDPSFTPVDPGATVDTGPKVQWKQVVLPASGRYRLTVAAEGTGDYSLSVTSKARTAWSETLNLGVEDVDSFPFAAPVGSLLSFRAAPVPGSGCNPVIEGLTIGEANIIEFVETVKGVVHTATFGPLAEGGEMYASIFNDAGTAGDALVSVKVKPPKAKPGKFDLRGVALGRPSGGETLVGRMLDGDGGTVTAEDEEGDLYGASVTFPADALAGPTLVTLASTPPPPIGDPDDQAAGPAVDFGPSGVVFGAPALITLPIDPALIPADADITDVRILIVEDNGESRIEFPTGFNAGSVTVETTGFSVCCPIIQSGPPALGLNPGGDEYWYLEFLAEMYGGAQDSRQRSLSVTLGAFSFYGDGTLQAAGDQRGFSWQNQDAPGGSGLPISAGLAQFSQGDGVSLNWAYDASGRRIVLSGSPEELPTFRISRDGRYVAGRHDASVEPDGQALFGVRKNTAALTAASIQGTWTCLYLEADVSNDPTTGAAYPKTARGTGTFQFDGTTGCRVSFTQRRPRFVPATQSFVHETESATVNDGTYAIDVDGTVLVTLPGIADGGGDTILRAYPGDGLELMFCRHDTFVGNAAMGMVLVRQGSGLSKASLSGDYHGADVGVDPQSYFTSPPSSVPVGDFSCRQEGILGVFDGGATASFTFDVHSVQRDSGNPDGVLKENYVDTLVAGVSVTSTGKLVLDGGEGKIVGQVSRDAQFFVGVTDLANTTQDYSMFFAFRAPPDKSP
jgi:hypothetical protein